MKHRSDSTFSVTDSQVMIHCESSLLRHSLCSTFSLYLSHFWGHITFVASPFILFFFPYLVNLPLDITQLQLLLFSFGLFFIGLAIFFMSGKIWNGVLELTVRFLKWNINVFKGS